MSTRRDAALEFIKRRFAERGQGPSLGELAHALGTNKPRAAAILKALERAGLASWAPGGPGRRGVISLPDPLDQVSVGDALRVLRRATDVMGPGEVHRLFGAMMLPVTQTNLPMVAVLSHLDHVDVAVGTGADEDDADCPVGDGR